MKKIKPCPECGNMPLWFCRVLAGRYPFEPRLYIECKACKYCAPKAYTLSGAVRKWNRTVKKYRTEKHPTIHGS